MATEEELKGIAAQLRCPDGHHGVQVGDNMNETNMQMTVQTIAALKLQDADRVLELGYGNAGHVADLFGSAINMTYTGADISETMQSEACRMNKELTDRHPESICFDCYDGENLPYSNAAFNKIFTVNTLYFWSDPSAMLQEMARVAEPGALLAITFASKTFMRTLPFTQYGFTLYEPGDLTSFIENSPWEMLEIIQKQEHVRSKVGDMVERIYYVLVLQRS